MEAVGDVVFNVLGSEVKSITLTDVYVPEATMTFFSICSAVKRGLEVFLSCVKTGEFCTSKKGGRLVARGDARAGIIGMVGHAAQFAFTLTKTPAKALVLSADAMGISAMAT